MNFPKTWTVKRPVQKLISLIVIILSGNFFVNYLPLIFAAKEPNVKEFVFYLGIMLLLYMAFTAIIGSVVYAFKDGKILLNLGKIPIRWIGLSLGVFLLDILILAIFYSPEDYPGMTFKAIPILTILLCFFLILIIMINILDGEDSNNSIQEETNSSKPETLLEEVDDKETLEEPLLAEYLEKEKDPVTPSTDKKTE